MKTAKKINFYIGLILLLGLLYVPGLREKAMACTENKECLGDEYCQKADGDCEGEGECATRPEECLLLWDPVCGCDGNTYGNSCEAARAGVNVDYSGECEAKECLENGECLADEYCQKTDGDCAGKGGCASRPEECPLSWEPVCGCDGNTYGNSCEAARAGVNIDYSGECKAQECTENEDCSGEDYCKKADHDCEGDGICSEKPVKCPPIVRPVCGCDGKIYKNPCLAASAGVNIAPRRMCRGPRHDYIRRGYNGGFIKRGASPDFTTDK